MTDRDARFKQILRSQFGEKGLALVTNLSIAFLFVFVMLVATVVAFHQTTAWTDYDATVHDGADALVVVMPPVAIGK